MCHLRPLLVEVPVDVVVGVVALLAALIDAVFVLLVVFARLALPRVHQGVKLLVVLVLDVLAAGAVAAFATNILEMGGLLVAAVASVVLEADDVADDALAVKLTKGRALGSYQRGERVAVAGILPNIEGFLVAFLARLGADVCRLRKTELHGMLLPRVFGKVVIALDLLGVLFQQAQHGVGRRLFLGSLVVLD